MTEWLDAASSDPAALQWMVGSPPPPDKLIQFADGSAFRFPRTRWSYSNVRRLVPTSAVPRGAAVVTLDDDRLDVRLSLVEAWRRAGCVFHDRHDRR